MDCLKLHKHRHQSNHALGVVKELDTRVLKLFSCLLMVLCVCLFFFRVGGETILLVVTIGHTLNRMLEILRLAAFVVSATWALFNITLLHGIVQKC